MRAFFFDAGNTLLELDYEGLARVSAGFLRAVTAEQVRSAEWRARLKVDTPQAVRDYRDADRWWVYMEALCEALGVRLEARREFVRSVLAEHRRSNLWKRSPDGVVRVLKELKSEGWRLGVISNSQGNVEELLRQVGLRDFFDVVFDSARFGVEKPDPRIFVAALEAIGASASEAWHIGDMYHIDVVGATAAGIRGILMDPGNLNADRQCYRITCWSELGGLLEASRGGSQAP